MDRESGPFLCARAQPNICSDQAKKTLKNFSKPLDKPDFILYNKDRKREEITEMTREEIEKRLEEIEVAEWNLSMADHWTQGDWDYSDKLSRERRLLRAKLAELTA